MARRNYEEGAPFSTGFGSSIGRGQDNIVVPLKGERRGEERPDVLVKFNHSEKGSGDTDVESKFRKIQYKKKKYELLRLFLGDFIPESSFLLGSKLDGTKKIIKEYTVQRRIPQITVKDLPPEKLNSPVLIKNLHKLIVGLIEMNKIVQQVNAEVEKDARVDVRLDLGRISSLVNEVQGAENLDIESISPELLSSKNLLVDPETLSLYCIDFGRGEWSDKKEATKVLIEGLVSLKTKK